MASLNDIFDGCRKKADPIFMAATTDALIADAACDGCAVIPNVPSEELGGWIGGIVGIVKLGVRPEDIDEITFKVGGVLAIRLDLSVDGAEREIVSPVVV